MTAKQKCHDATWKTRVALRALKGEMTMELIAKDFNLHPVRVSEWEKKLLESAAGDFCQGRQRGLRNG